jgi:hypothetical protein
MSSQVKDAGDRVLAEGGTTPTQIVRALWEKISHGVADLRQVEQVLGVATQGEPTNAVDVDRVDAMRRGRNLFVDGLAEWGVSYDDVLPCEEVSDADCYTKALLERMRERDLW